MIEITVDYLLNTLDEETAIKLWENLEGMRIYFKKNSLKHYKITKDYKLMTSDKPQRIKDLAYKYEMSTSNIRKILRKKEVVLFDE